MKPMQLIRSVFSCSFTLEYLLHVTKRAKGGQFFLNMNRAIWEACKSTDVDLCIKPQFVQEICSHFPIQLVKEVRLSLTEVMTDGMIDSNDPDLAGEYTIKIYLNLIFYISTKCVSIAGKWFIWSETQEQSCLPEPIYLGADPIRSAVKWLISVAQ